MRPPLLERAPQRGPFAKQVLLAYRAAGMTTAQVLQAATVNDARLLGMADQIEVMILAVVLAVGFMMVFAGPTSRFVERHPTVKILALSFLLLIGFTLVAEGLDQHIPKGYIYFAMAFSLLVEMLNLRLRAKSTPVQLRERHG